MADLPKSASECPRTTPTTVITENTSQTNPKWALAANAWKHAQSATITSAPVLQDPRKLKRKSVITEDESEISQAKKAKSESPRPAKAPEDVTINNNTEENTHIKTHTPDVVHDPSTSIKSGKSTIENNKDQKFKIPSKSRENCPLRRSRSVSMSQISPSAFANPTYVRCLRNSAR